MAAASPVVAAVDIGGTKILSAVVDAAGNILSTHLCLTEAARGTRATTDNIIKSVRAAICASGLSPRQIRGIGLGAPGISNPAEGVVYCSPNIPDWNAVPLRSIIEDGTGKRAFLINDANAAALGELAYGAAVGVKNYVYVTVSTGIGGGIIIDGKLYTGSRGMAGEVGHMVVEPDGMPCNCGSHGCWELYASGTAIARRAREKIVAGSPTALTGMAGGDPARIDAPMIARAARAGDNLSQQLIKETARYLAMGFGNIINVLNPELIVVGGGLTKMGGALMKPAFKQAGDWSYREMFRRTRFAIAKLGENSGVLGAAVWAREKLVETKAQTGKATLPLS
jgi:glucokinase